MPSQAKIISVVNDCLKQLPNTDYSLNSNGMCAGLDSLFIKYSLQNKTAEFFKILKTLSTLPKNYKIGENPVVDNFITQLEQVHRPFLYTNFEQGQLEKFLTINNKPLRNEFNFGLIAEEDAWEEILTQIARPNRAYFITSHNHAIALLFKNGQFLAYDPNNEGNGKTFKTAKDVIQELKKGFEYTSTQFGLSIRAFSHPEQPPCTDYPAHRDLHQIALPKEDNYHYAFVEKTTTYQSSFFAKFASDNNTLEHLVMKDAIHWEKVTPHELKSIEVNEFLLKSPTNPSKKQALLLSIEINIQQGNASLVKRLKNQYDAEFTKPQDQQDLASRLQQTFADLHVVHRGIMFRPGNYRYLMELCEPFTTQPIVFANYLHLALLHLSHETTNPETLSSLFENLTDEQILQQINVAAFSNQQTILISWMKEVRKRHMDLSAFRPFFNEELINKINEQTLRLLCDNGVHVEPKLLPYCLKRKDKSIYEYYIRAYLKQSKLVELEKVINGSYSKVDLETPIPDANIKLIDVLVFLRKNQQIRQFWRNDLRDETLTEALYYAIYCGNEDISQFLQEKLIERKLSLPDVDIEALYTIGLQDENLTVLALLASFKYKVLKIADVEKIFFLSMEHTNYIFLVTSFNTASEAIKRQLFELTMQYRSQYLYDFFEKEHPQYFRILLIDLARRPKSKERDALLSGFNSKFDVLPKGTLDPMHELDEATIKELVKSCFEKKYFKLGNNFLNTVTWSAEELSQFLMDLIAKKNEAGLIHLLKAHPSLLQHPHLVELVLTNNLLDVIQHLVGTKIPIDDAFYATFWEAGYKGNHKALIESLIQSNKVPPQPTLTDQLKRAIQLGKQGILEPFVNTQKDFGIDFKELFFYCCTWKQAGIANVLLTKEISLNGIEVNRAVSALFDDTSSSAIFDRVYQGEHGRLYSLVMKAKIANPRSSLLKSTQSPERDLRFQKSGLYFSLLRQALQEENTDKFATLFNQAKWPETPDPTVYAFINEHYSTPNIITLFKDQYTWQTLLIEALAKNEWSIVALVLEQHNLDELSAEEREKINRNRELIVNGFVEGLERTFDKRDVRSRLFDLIRPDSIKNGLKEIAVSAHDHIYQTIVGIELKMLEQGMDLNEQVYRHSLSMKSFDEALREIDQLVHQCIVLIRTGKVQLDQPLTHENFLTNFSQIKALMAQHNISSFYLSDQQNDLLERLTEHPQLKLAIDLELQVYGLMQQFNLSDRSLQMLLADQQQIFKEALSALHKELAAKHLNKVLVLPSIQSYLSHFEKTGSFTPSPDPIPETNTTKDNAPETHRDVLPPETEHPPADPSAIDPKDPTENEASTADTVDTANTADTGDKAESIDNAKENPPVAKNDDPSSEKAAESLAEDNDAPSSPLATPLEAPLSPISKATERKCEGIIAKKLLPLTKNYLFHLFKEIESVNHNKFDLESIPSAIQAAQNANLPQDLLKEKFDSVVSLYNILTTPDTNKKPSQRVTEFYNQLNAQNEQIKAHRDHRWKRYVTNAVIIIGIALTGILPGLALLSIFASSPGRSAKFWQAQGQNFVDSCEDEKVVKRRPER